MTSPLSSTALFHLGPVPVTAAVLTTWAIMAGLALAGMCAKRKLNADCLPNLSEVYQCQLDDNFQKLTEGEKEWRKRNQRKAQPEAGNCIEEDVEGELHARNC